MCCFSRKWDGNRTLRKSGLDISFVKTWKSQELVIFSSSNVDAECNTADFDGMH